MKCANAKRVSERMLSKLSFNDSGRPVFNTYSICLPVTVRVVLTRNITTEVDNLVFVVHVIIIIVPLYCRLCMWDNSWLVCSGHIIRGEPASRPSAILLFQ